MENKEKSERYCLAPGHCPYQYLTSTSYGCRFKNYCDYQVPRDSRLKKEVKNANSKSKQERTKGK